MQEGIPMDDIIKEMLSLRTWAVAGATHNPDKYANKIFHRLKSHNYNVYSLNPSGVDVDGEKSYKFLSELPERPDVISMVINHIRGKDIIKDAINSNIKYIWFQPGAETNELIDMARNAGIAVVYNRCVLVEL